MSVITYKNSVCVSFPAITVQIVHIPKKYISSFISLYDLFLLSAAKNGNFLATPTLLPFRDHDRQALKGGDFLESSCLC